MKARPKLRDTQPAPLTAREGHRGGQTLGWCPLRASAQACCAVHEVYVCVRVHCVCLCTGVQRCVPLACLPGRVGSLEMGVSTSWMGRQVCRRASPGGSWSAGGRRKPDSGQRKGCTPGARPLAAALPTPPRGRRGAGLHLTVPGPWSGQALSRAGLQRARALSTGPLTPSLQAALLTEFPGLTVPS